MKAKVNVVLNQSQSGRPVVFVELVDTTIEAANSPNKKWTINVPNDNKLVISALETSGLFKEVKNKRRVTKKVKKEDIELIDISLSESEMLDLLSTDGMLVKRPLVVGEDYVLTGFKEKEWAKKLLK